MCLIDLALVTERNRDGKQSVVYHLGMTTVIPPAHLTLALVDSDATLVGWREMVTTCSENCLESEQSTSMMVHNLDPRLP